MAGATSSSASTSDWPANVSSSLPAISLWPSSAGVVCSVKHPKPDFLEAASCSTAARSSLVFSGKARRPRHKWVRVDTDQPLKSQAAHRPRTGRGGQSK